MSDGYEALETVLKRAGERKEAAVNAVLHEAFLQSAEGKGSERHSEGNELDWESQPIFTIPDLINSDGFTIGQAMKKLHEQQGMSWERGRTECLGAIVYLSAAAVRLERDMQPFPDRNPSILISMAGRVQSLIRKLTSLCTPGQSQSAKRTALVDVIADIGQYVAERDGETNDSDPRGSTAVGDRPDLSGGETRGVETGGDRHGDNEDHTGEGVQPVLRGEGGPDSAVVERHAEDGSGDTDADEAGSQSVADAADGEQG